MKNKPYLLLLLITGFSFLLSTSAHAGLSVDDYPRLYDEHPNGVDGVKVGNNICKINNGGWNEPYGDTSNINQLTLLTALIHSFAVGEVSMDACKKGITLETAVNPLGPITFKRSGQNAPGAVANAEEAPSAEQWVFDGQGNTIDFGGINDGWAGKWVRAHLDDFGGRLCAIKVKGSNIVVKNVNIVGVPADWSGICFSGGNNRLENVHIEMQSDDTTSAIVFRDSANLNLIDKKTTVAFGSGYGVEYPEGTSSSNNFIEFSTPGEGAAAVDGVLLADSLGEGFRTVGNSPERFYKNTRADLKVLLERVAQADESGSKYLYKGCLVSNGQSSGRFIINLPAQPGFEHFWLIPQLGNQVGSPSQRITVNGVLTGKDENGQNINCLAFPASTDPVSTIQIYPEQTAQGSTTSLYGLIVPAGNNQYGIFPALQNPGNQAGGGGNFSGGASFGGIKGVAYGFRNLDECLCNKREGAFVSNCQFYSRDEMNAFDTDGDGKRDVDEDLNGDCTVDANETDWRNPDSDGDGLIDGNSFEKKCKAGEEILEGDICRVAAVGATLNGRNADVDGDTLLDGEEDRNVYYPLYRQENSTGAAPGYLYFVDDTQLQNIPVTYPAPDPEDESESPRMIPTPRPCTLLGTGSEVGVSYNWWTLTLTEGGVYGEPMPLATADIPRPVVAEGQAEPTEVTVLLACRSIVLRSDPTAFNGKFDSGSLETDLGLKDSEVHSGDNQRGDGVNDNVDKCPTLVKGLAGEANGCPKGGQVAECSDKLLYFGVDRRFIKFEADNFTPVKIRDDNENDIADVLEPAMLVQILSKYGILVEADLNNPKKIADVMHSMAPGDLDQDGLPDILENQAATQAAELTGLSFCDRDSDNDGLFDGPGIGVQQGALSDVCPQDKADDVANGGISVKDQFSEDENHRYSCGVRDEALENVYGTLFTKALAYFLDRDNDGLCDACEDIDLNGTFDEKKIHEIRITETIRKGLESHPLDKDSDNDGLSDKDESLEVIRETDSEGNSVSYFTNPGDSDSDGDQLADLAEITRDGNPEIHVDIDKRDGGCAATKEKDTDPTNPDTDFDGLLDGSEDSGILYAAPGEILSDLLKNPTFFQGNEDARRLYSSPVDKHSDGDGLTDAEEYNIVFEEGMKPQAVPALTRTMTNPCEGDTDGDSQDDNFDAEKGQCGTFGGDNAESCIPIEDEQALGGQDQDGDSLSDARERILGTDINNPDSDLDGLWDGQEDCNRNGRGIGVEMCDWTGFRETDPLLADTDGDGLNDNLEVSFGGGSSPVVVAGVSETTDPTNPDSDGDGIPDGPGGLVAGPNGEPVQSLGEDANANGRYDTGETDPRNPDTDGDGLADGLIGGLGEDFNRNGIVDKDAKGRLLETDPRVPDTDFDGRPDGDEAMRNGRFNISRATNYNDGGCSLVTNGQGSMPAAVSFFFGLVMLATTTVRRKVKNAVSKAA